MVLFVECVGLANGDGEPGRFGCPLNGISNSTNSRSYNSDGKFRLKPHSTDAHIRCSSMEMDIPLSFPNIAVDDGVAVQRYLLRGMCHLTRCQIPEQPTEPQQLSSY